MAEEKSPNPETRRNFQDFLAACPAAETPAAGLVVAGMVLRSEKEGSFVLRTADEAQHEVPVEAVQDFTVLSGPAGMRSAQLSLNPELLGADLADALRRAQTPGGFKSPFEKVPPFDKLPFEKAPPFDTLKEPPFETLKEPPADTLKEPPFDTLKEIGGGGDTLKEPPFETLKEPPGDTLKEQPFDTLKEVIDDTVKEVGKDPILDGGGGGTGIADTLVETIPGTPGGPVIQPQALRAAAPVAAKFPPGDTVKEQPFDTLKEIGGGDTLKGQPFDTLKELPGDTLKEQPFDTLKEVGGGDTLKELPGDTLKEQPFDTLKEIGGGDTLKEIGKDPIGDGGGTGIADTLVETTFPTPGPVVQPAVGGQGVAPFVLATPHQAPQGALAQQYLAAQMARGMLGL